MLHNSIDFITRTPAAPDDCPLGGIPRQDVLQSHLAMVRSIAWRVYSTMSSSVEFEDLVQIGIVALIECADSYEDQGYAFATYASTRVRGAMIDQLRKSARMTRSAMIGRRRLSTTSARLEQRLMRPPHAVEMAEALHMDINAFYGLVNNAVAVESGSLDEVYSDYDSHFADLAPRADTGMEERAIHAQLSRCIAKLAEREAKILQLFFVEEQSLQQIGQTLGIGAARVCQIKKSALQTLRSQMESAESD